MSETPYRSLSGPAHQLCLQLVKDGRDYSYSLAKKRGMNPSLAYRAIKELVERGDIVIVDEKPFVKNPKLTVKEYEVTEHRILRYLAEASFGGRSERLEMNGFLEAKGILRWLPKLHEFARTQNQAAAIGSNVTLSEAIVDMLPKAAEKLTVMPWVSASCVRSDISMEELGWLERALCSELVNILVGAIFSFPLYHFEKESERDIALSFLRELSKTKLFKPLVKKELDRVTVKFQQLMKWREESGI